MTQQITIWVIEHGEETWQDITDTVIFESSSPEPDSWSYLLIPNLKRGAAYGFAVDVEVNTLKEAI